MDLFFILRDADGSSAISTLVAARDAKKAGHETAVLVTQGALSALATGSFEWPRALSGPPMRLALAAAGKTLGLPVSGGGAAKALDPKALVAEVGGEGVTLLACPVWTALLGIEESLPAGLTPASSETVTNHLATAGQVIGSL